MMDEEFVTIEHQNQVAILKLNRGITNAINGDLVLALDSALKSQAADPDVLGMVLTSSNNKFFSIGLDIPNLFALGEKDFRSFYQSFNQMCLGMLTTSKPLVAGITGHAIAGGCILSLCCDYRFISEGRKLIGLNEIKLGVPVPYVADCILRKLIGYRNARDVMDSGGFLEPEEAQRLGVIDRILPIEEVVSQSIEKARELSSDSLEAFSLIKSSRVHAVEREIAAQLSEREDAFIKCWFSDDARVCLKDAISKY
ncbi:MAG: enoyl-CoA hydratase/isomerase family protein [Anaerolineales bacterium]|nr:MAG: enoyl-CoA hydratase/isomerase family protein [Anaerolineales bacterium]